MPTSNLNITKAWTKVADATNYELLVSWESPVTLEVALTATDTAPTVTGHKVFPESAITRSILGAGFVWMRQASSGPEGVSLVVTK